MCYQYIELAKREDQIDDSLVLQRDKALQIVCAGFPADSICHYEGVVAKLPLEPPHSVNTIEKETHIIFGRTEWFRENKRLGFVFVGDNKIAENQSSLAIVQDGLRIERKPGVPEGGRDKILKEWQTEALRPRPR